MFQIFDGVVILASFALDLVFLEGLVGVQGEEAAALLVMFLLWRILRVINGMMCSEYKLLFLISFYQSTAGGDLSMLFSITCCF